MKPKTGKELEEELDKEFERMGIKLKTYHFRDAAPFNGVTIVINNEDWTYNIAARHIYDCIRPCEALEHNISTCLLENLTKHGIYGVGICNERDQFSRLEGRNEAKRKLLRYIKRR